MVQDKSDDLEASELSEHNEMARLLEEEISKMPSLRRGEALEGKVILINEEGEIVDQFKKLTKIFECSMVDFCLW